MLIDSLSVNDIDGEMQDIAECIGIDAFKKLVRLCGGQMIYIPKADSVARPVRNRLIKSEFNGANYRRLASKYGLTERRVREIVAMSDRVQ